MRFQKLLSQTRKRCVSLCTLIASYSPRPHLQASEPAAGDQHQQSRQPASAPWDKTCPARQCHSDGTVAGLFTHQSPMYMPISGENVCKCVKFWYSVCRVDFLFIACGFLFMCLYSVFSFILHICHIIVRRWGGLKSNLGLLNDYYRNFLSLSFSIVNSRLLKSNIYFCSIWAYNCAKLYLQELLIHNNFFEPATTPVTL